MNTKLDGKVALITGASSGIGAATAVHFAELGAKLALTGRNITNLQETSRLCKEKGSVEEPLIIVADLRKEDDTSNVVKTTISRFGQMDILVNNAGILYHSGMADGNLSHFDQLVATNLRPPYHLSSLALPHLVASKGNIINISSLAGMRPYPIIGPYSVLKSALDQMTQCSALEFAPKGVRVNSVNPGLVRTNIHVTSGMTEEMLDKLHKDEAALYPLGRTGETDDVVGIIAFLASDAASFITCAIIPVDGGRHLSS